MEPVTEYYDYKWGLEMKRFTRIGFRVLAAAVSLTVALSFAGITALATATGTVSGSGVRVRASASTDSSVVGNLSGGDTVEVTAEEQDASGQTWYAVTLSNGQKGYIRGDLLSVSGEIGAEEAPAETEPAEVDTTTPAETDTSTTPAATTTQTSDQYQLVLSPDPQTGENVWYLYFTEDGERLKVSDIQDLANRLDDAQKNQGESAKKFRILMIVFLVLFLLAAGACILLFFKLRDMMSGDVDLARERSAQRKVNRNADAVTIRRSGEGSRSSRERSDAYPAGERSAERRTGTGAVRPAERSNTRRPSEGSTSASTSRRPAGEPARDREYDRERTVRPDARRSAEAGSRRPVERDYSSADQRESGVHRSSAEGASVREGRESVRTARPEAKDGIQPARRESAGRPEQAPRRQPQARNFADADDDMGYGFLNSKRGE